MQNAEQFIAAQKAQAEAVFALASKTFDGVERTAELNLQTAKTLLGEAAAHAQAVLAAKDAQQLLALQAGLLQPAAQKAAAYGRHVVDIATTTGTEAGKVVEARVAELQKGFLAALDSALQHAPAGSENAVALVKSSVTAAGNVFESVQEAARQAARHAAEAAEANFKRATAGAQSAA